MQICGWTATRNMRHETLVDNIGTSEKPNDGDPTENIQHLTEASVYITGAVTLRRQQTTVKRRSDDENKTVRPNRRKRNVLNSNVIRNAIGSLPMSS